MTDLSIFTQRVEFLMSMYPDIHDVPYEDLDKVIIEYEDIDIDTDLPEEDRKHYEEMRVFLHESIVGSMVKTLKTKYTPTTAPTELLEKLYNEVKDAKPGENWYIPKQFVRLMIEERNDT